MSYNYNPNKEISLAQFKLMLSNKNKENALCFDWNYGKSKPDANDSVKPCPIFKDKIGYKSFTIIVEKRLQDQAEYWCGYFHGANSISNTMDLDNTKNGKVYVAIRSDYQAW